MSRVYEVVFDNVAVSAVQDLVQINGAAGKTVRILRRWVGSTDVPVATQQELALRERLLPSIVTNGNGALTTPSKTDNGDSAPSFTALCNSTIKATTSGAASLLGTYGVHIFNGFDEEPDEFYPIGPSQAYVWELETTPTAPPIHLSGGVAVEELGGGAAAFSFPAGATAIYSTRLAVAGYAGKCVQLINNAATTLDIGFDGTGNIDTAAATAFMSVSQGFFMSKWYDQSGNGRDAVSNNTSKTTFNIVNGRGIVVLAGGLFTVQPGPSDAGVIPAVNSDQTLGLVVWPDNSAGDLFFLTHYSGVGWMLITNHGGNPYKGVYWSATPGVFTPTTAKLTNKSPSRLVCTRTSGALALYVNGVASGTATGQSNSAPTGHINIGGYQDNTAASGGFLSEVFIYGSALTTGQLSTIDANEAATFPTLGLETPYNGQASWAQFGPTQSINLGNVLQYEYTQAWTCFAAIQVYDPTDYKIVFSNVPTTGPAYPGYELWIDTTNGFQVLHVKLMHDFGAGQYAGIWGSVNVVDGKKHIVAASYDGSGTAAGISLFVDGVKDTATHVESDTLGGRTIIASGQSFLVGQQQGQHFGLGGAISYFQLDKVKRSDAYIAAITPVSGTPVPPVDANTAVLLKLNTGSGTTANDTSGNGLNGTLSDAGMWTP